jgi:hypothetical protein
MVKLLAKAKRKMKQVRATVAVIMTILGPKRSAAQPLTCRQSSLSRPPWVPTKRPMIPPAEEPLDKADCH